MSTTPPLVETPPAVPVVLAAAEHAARPTVHARKRWYRDALGVSLAGGGVIVVALGAGLFGAGRSWISDANGAHDYARFAVDAPRAADGANYEGAGIGLFAFGGVLIAAATVRLAIVGRRR